MTKQFKIICIFLTGIFLLPLLFFPLSGDAIVFMDVARKILEGKTLYIDTIDLKPPLIYYIHIPVYLLSQGSEIVVRIIDVIYQIIIIYSAWYVTFRLTGNRKTGMIAGVFYSLIYVSLGAQQTFQSDTHFNILIIWTIYFVLIRKPSVKVNLLLGVFLGIMFCIKYNMLAVFVPVSVFTWYYHSENRRINGLFRTTLVQLCGFVIVVLLMSVPLMNPEVFNGFADVFNYTSFYSSMPPYDSQLIKYIIQTGSLVIGYNFSLLFVGLAFLSIIYFFKIDNKNESNASYLQYLLIIALTLFFTILVEKKLHIYHFSRMLSVMAILTAYGAGFLAKTVQEANHKMGKMNKTIILGLTLAVLLFSPLPRWLNLMRLPYYYIADNEQYDAMFERDNEAANTRVQIKQLTGFILANSTPSDTVINVSTGANSINLFLRELNTSAFEQSCFYLGIHKTAVWQERIKNEFQSAKWVVVQNNDGHLFINGHRMASWEALQKDTVLYPILAANFSRVFETKNFYVFKRTM